MPILAGIIVALAQQLAGFFAAWMSKKVAMGLAATSVIVAFNVALLVAFRAAFQPLWAAASSYSHSTLMLAHWAALAFPSVSGTCIAAIFTTWSACLFLGVKRQVSSAILAA